MICHFSLLIFLLLTYYFILLLLSWNYELIALTVDVDDFNLVIILEVLTKLCDVNIHRTCIEVVIINPDGLQGEVTLENLICMATKQREKFVLLCCELNHLISIGKELLLCIENEATRNTSSSIENGFVI